LQGLREAQIVGGALLEIQLGKLLGIERIASRALEERSL